MRGKKRDQYQFLEAPLIPEIDGKLKKQVMKTAINFLRHLVQLGHECKTFPSSTVFKSLQKNFEKTGGN